MPDADCLRFAAKLLKPYRLSPTEREQETEALAQQIDVAVEAYLESIEHRR